ncbi:MAG: Crp/Fnr family transcriptional regulator [Burkholderiales bacterium]
MTNSAQKTAKDLALSLIGKTLGFRDCHASTLNALVLGGHIRHYGKGEAVVRRGEAFDALCLIIQGSLETSINHPDGHRQLISFLQPGDVAGMISVLDGLGHVNDLFARERGTAALLIPGELVRSLRAQDRTLAHAFELQLAFRSRLMYERLATHPGTELDMRLARMIVVLSRVYGVEVPKGILLAVKMSQADLGDLLGVTRQHINYALSQLKELGLIEMKYSTITVLSLDQLQAFANHLTTAPAG